MEQNITPLVHLLSTADAETIAMNLDEIEYEYAYYLAIHQANEECLATDVHTAHNKIYWLRRLRNVFAQVAGIGFPT
ncbi:MAG: hypothetical protein LC109_03400, partial [Bacteroidia bacterium]|nr:hypothetical protein [Bacteroidia bacterium]